MSLDALSEHSFFFTKQERDTLAAAPSRPASNGGSLLGRLLRPVINVIDLSIPETVAPNTIALIGALSALQAFHVATTYLHPSAGTVSSSSNTAIGVIGALLFASSLCSVLVDTHGRRCRSHSSVGNVFIECASAARSVFFAATLVPLLGVDADPIAAWYFCVGLQLLRLVDMCLRVSAKVPGKVVTASYLVTSAELTLAQLALICAKWLRPAATEAIFLQYVAPYVTREYTQLFFNTSLVVAVAAVALLRAPSRSMLPLLICLASRAVPSFMLPFNELTTTLSTLADASVLALVHIEVYVSSQSQRTTHLGVTAIALGSLFNAPIALTATALYVVGVLSDLAFFTNTPLFVPIRNVYIDGVFDMCHIGHKKLMENALKHGNRLICGVMGDEDCIKYKRRPIMTTEERCAEVRACKHVSQVIPCAPCFGITEDFIKQHNIHVVVFGEEYNKPDDKYYAAARKMGIGRIAPRTGGISTSDLIKRIRQQTEEELVAKDKASGQSTVKV